MTETAHLAGQNALHLKADDPILHIDGCRPTRWFQRAVDSLGGDPIDSGRKRVPGVPVESVQIDELSPAYIHVKDGYIIASDVDIFDEHSAPHAIFGAVGKQLAREHLSQRRPLLTLGILSKLNVIKLI